VLNEIVRISKSIEEVNSTAKLRLTLTFLLVIPYKA